MTIVRTTLVAAIGCLLFSAVFTSGLDFDPAAIKAKRDKQNPHLYNGEIPPDGSMKTLTRFAANMANGIIMFSTEGYADIDDPRITSYAQAQGIAEEHAKLRIQKEAAKFIAGGVLSYYESEEYMKLTSESTMQFMQNVLVKGLIRDTLYFERAVSKSGQATPVAHLRMAYLLRDEDNPALSGACALFGSFVQSLRDAGYEEAAAGDSTASTDAGGRYTSVIIDLTGHAFAPALFPIVTVEGEQKRVVYSGAHLDKAFIGKYGTVCYLKKQEDGRKMDRLCVDGTYNPLVIKAVSVRGVQKGNIQVSKESAVRIMAADIHHGILKQARVGLLVK